ncbi:hypothetical protein NC652_030144 [Populus alba x Populus x berolinensis]|nr:hypothetical protein NC652_030144 [Populus alba x Populus x berolinensis]
MRGKIAMPVPGNSRGKFARVLVSHFTPDDESKVQLHDFVDRVHNGIKKMVADCAKRKNSIDQWRQDQTKKLLIDVSKQFPL